MSKSSELGGSWARAYHPSEEDTEDRSNERNKERGWKHRNVQTVEETVHMHTWAKIMIIIL